MKAPLEGVRILDLTTLQNGAYTTVFLSDMGADVIKIEDPLLGDPGRNLIPQAQRHPLGICVFFEAMNRNKRSMTLDLKKPQGKEIFYRMVKTADVVVHNFRHGVAERLGVDYASLVKHNPRVISASGSGFGRQGPDVRRPLFDIVGQARGGLLKLMSFPGEPVENLALLGLADQTGAIILTAATLTALLARERYGIGQDVEVSQLGAQMLLQYLAIANFLGSHEHPVRLRRAEARNPLYNTYECRDHKWLVLGCLQADRHWPNLCQVLGLGALELDPRFKDMTVRAHHGPELVAILDQAFATRPRDEWLRLLQERDIVCGPVNDYADLEADPQVIANEYLAELDHPVAGKIKLVGMPIKLSATPGRVRSAAPQFGQHTEEVLLEAGYSWAEIEQFHRDGTI